MDTEQLEQWLKEAQQELEDSRKELANAQQKVFTAEEKVRSLETLLDSEGLTQRAYPSQDGDVLVSTLEEILQQSNGPLSIPELKKELLEREVPIPGQGRDANLIAKMQRSDGRIIRVSRGQYDIPRAEGKARLVLSDKRIIPIVDELLLGRADDCDVILTDPLASRHHAVIKLADGEATIEDKRSANGTLVNERSIKKANLYHGDSIVIGDTVLVFETL